MIPPNLKYPSLISLEYHPVVICSSSLTPDAQAALESLANAAGLNNVFDFSLNDLKDHQHARIQTILNLDIRMHAPCYECNQGRLGCALNFFNRLIRSRCSPRPRLYRLSVRANTLSPSTACVHLHRVLLILSRFLISQSMRMIGFAALSVKSFCETQIRAARRRCTAEEQTLLLCTQHPARISLCWTDLPVRLPSPIGEGPRGCDGCWRRGCGVQQHMRIRTTPHASKHRESLFLYFIRHRFISTRADMRDAVLERSRSQ
jgi:hypothetical protein